MPRTTTALLLTAALLLYLTGCGATSSEPREERINDGVSVLDLVVSRGGPDEGLYAVATDTAREWRLTDGPDTAPDWSPDGREIVFARGREVGASKIMIARVVEEQGVPKLVSMRALARGSSPSFSDDGRSVLFSGLDGLFEVSPDGDTTRMLAEEPALDATGPSNRRTVVFSSIGAPGLREIDLETGRVRVLTSERDAGPAVASDNSIVFSRAIDELGERRALFRLDVRGGVHQLTDGESSDWTPSISIDGRRVAFVREPVRGNTLLRIRTSEIYTLDTETGQLKRLTENSELDQDPAWRPSSQTP